MNHEERAREIVNITLRWWCAHVRQGMCERCQDNRLRDVEDKIRQEVETAVADHAATVAELRGEVERLRDQNGTDFSTYENETDHLRNALTESHALLRECREEFHAQHDPEDSMAMARRIDAVLGEGEG